MLDGVKAVWESDRYDRPLSGHAWYNGDYGVFKIANRSKVEEGDTPVYAFFRAGSPEAAMRLLAIRQMFEDFVGHHCTYGVRDRYDPDTKAIDVEGYYGLGKPKHPLGTYLDELPEDVEYVGDFTLDD